MGPLWFYSDPIPGDYAPGALELLMIAGHTAQTPRSRRPRHYGLSRQTKDKEDLRLAVREHVTSMATRYADFIDAWDVTNKTCNRDYLDLFGPKEMAVWYNLRPRGRPTGRPRFQRARSLTIAFAHPMISGIQQWGFWEGARWIPSAALWRRDWTIKPAGQAYIDLVFKTWWPDASVRTNAQGEARVRGFHAPARSQSVKAPPHAMSPPHSMLTARRLASLTHWHRTWDSGVRPRLCSHPVTFLRQLAEHSPQGSEISRRVLSD